jgi:tRNA threonylcarbamoyl adenosine modification protein (Sua5/YciO/YrdC/YwlC family)
MKIEIHPDYPEARRIRQVCDILESGGIVIIPTDTVYALVCGSDQLKAVDKICHVRHLEPERAMLSIFCRDISQVAAYAAQLSNETFRIIRRNTPGPFTFILKMSNSAQKISKNRKKTIGIRIPDHKVLQAILEEYGKPLVTTSLKTNDDVVEYYTDMADIEHEYIKVVDMIVESGDCGIIASTLIDCTEEIPEIIREGKGELL